MALSNCTECGSLYNKIRDEFCPSCMKELEEQFQKIKDYLKKNRNALMREVEEATEVPMATILKFLREGRLTSIAGLNLNYPCDHCGTPISSGNYCKRCTVDLSKNLQSAKESLSSKVTQTQNGTGYHFRDKK